MQLPRHALSHAEVMQDMAHYDHVKEYFIAPDANGSGRSQNAYQNFKAWKRRNAETIADLRRAAARQAGSCGPKSRQSSPVAPMRETPDVQRTTICQSPCRSVQTFITCSRLHNPLA